MTDAPPSDRSARCECGGEMPTRSHRAMRRTTVYVVACAACGGRGGYDAHGRTFGTVTALEAGDRQ